MGGSRKSKKISPPSIRQGALRRGNAIGDAGIDLGRVSECAGERLERDFDDVVEVIPLDQSQVQVAFGAAREAFKEDLGELDIEVADLRLWHRHSVDEIGPSAEIEVTAYERLIHREGRFTVAADAALITKCFGESAPERDAKVLCGVVRVDVYVALGTDSNIKEPMAGSCSTI